jgi:hypothetical protein
MLVVAMVANLGVDINLLPRNMMTERLALIAGENSMKMLQRDI